MLHGKAGGVREVGKEPWTFGFLDGKQLSLARVSAGALRRPGR